MNILFIGLFNAALTGVALPSFVFLIGDIIDAFDPESDRKEALEDVKRLTLIFVYIGVAVWITSYFFYGFLIVFSERVAKRTRLAYLKHLLTLDASFFDSRNYTEIPAKMNQEIINIQKGIGEKLGVVIFSIAMFFSGLVFGFLKGWNLALVILGITPFLVIGTALTTEQLQSGIEGTMKAYGQSAGYAQ